MKRALELVFLSVVATSALAACAATQEVIVETGVGRRASASEIDADPWALLPSGAVVWAQIDADSLLKAEYGAEVFHLLNEYLPLARGAGLEVQKDITAAHLGVYATVGTDVAAVFTGQFDANKVQQAAKDNPVAAHGRPIRINRFAGFEMLVVDHAAMVVVTGKTLVAGTEIGVRRVLERIEEGRLKRSLPPWYLEMLASKARFSFGIDLDAQPVPAAVRTKLAFLQGLRAGRLLGNFEQPGLNLAGTLTYDKPASAEAAADDIKEQVKAIDRYRLILSVMGISRPIRRLDARPTGKDTQLVAEIDGKSLRLVLERSDELLKQFAQ